MNNNTKKIIILVIGLLLASALLSSLCGIGSLGIRFFRSKSSGSDNTWTLKDNFSEIRIKSITGNVRIYESKDRTGKVVWNGNRNTKLNVGTSFGTLNVEEKFRLPWFLRIGLFTGSSEIQIYLPKGSYTKLNINSDTGQVEVPANFTFEQAAIETDTGSITFRAGVRGELKIDSDTGSVNVSGTAPENMHIETDTGRIVLSNSRVAKDLHVKTDTASISLTDVSCRDLEVKSDTGSLTLNNVRAGDQFEAKTDTGAIRLERCDGAKMELKSDTGSISGTVLSDKVFDARSGTGKVNVPETNNGGTCRCRSGTGSINIEIVR